MVHYLNFSFKVIYASREFDSTKKNVLTSINKMKDTRTVFLMKGLNLFLLHDTFLQSLFSLRVKISNSRYLNFEFKFQSLSHGRVERMGLWMASTERIAFYTKRNSTLFSELQPSEILRESLYF